MARQSWAAAEGNALSEALLQALRDMESQLAGAVARILQPFVEAEIRRASINELVATIETLLTRDQAAARIEVSGPEDLLCVLRPRLAGKIPAAFVTNEACDVRVVIDQTTLETRLGALDRSNRWGRAMSSGPNDEETTIQELVIIRRRGGGEDAAHHGGVWKIAYADFMTAMMAFFLVMWLINATDKKVLTQVATYFNPMRLTDKAPTPRGVHDVDAGAAGSEDEAGESKAKEGKAKASKVGPQQKIQEDALFKDPYGSLEKLAEQAVANEPKTRKKSTAGEAKNAEGTLAGGEAFRDPFDPQFRQSVIRPQTQATRPEQSEQQKAADEARPESSEKSDNFDSPEAGK